MSVWPSVNSNTTKAGTLKLCVLFRKGQTHNDQGYIWSGLGEGIPTLTIPPKNSTRKPIIILEKMLYN